MGGIALFLAVFFLALRTACPTVAFDDTGESCLAALTLGVPHPPGYPVFTLLTSLWARIPLGSVAFRLNIFSSVLAGIAAVLAYSVFVRMGGKGKYSGMLGAFLAVMFSAAWSQAGLGKGAVYILNLCLTLGILREAWDREHGFRPMLSASLLFGLGLAHHWMSMAPMAPVLALVVLRSGAGGRARRLLFSLVAVSTGLGVYLFLAIRASAGPFLDWADPRTIGNFLFVISRRQYLAFLPGEEAMSVGDKLGSLVRTLDGAIPWGIMLVLTGIGAVFLIRRDRWALLSTLCMPLAVIAGLVVLVPVRPGATWFLDVYSIPAVSLLVILACIGVEQVAMMAGPRRAYGAALLVSALFCAWTVPARSRMNDRARDYFTWDLAQNISGSCSEAGLMFGSSDAVIFGNWYSWLVEDKPHLIAVPVPLLPMAWVANGFANAVAGLRAPYPEPRVGAEAVPALLRAWGEANPGFPQWCFLTEPARAAFGRDRLLADGLMYRVVPHGIKGRAGLPINRLKHLRLRGIFTGRLAIDARQDASIRPLIFSGLLTWGRGVMERDYPLAQRAFHLAGMLGEGTPDAALCTLELGNLEAAFSRFGKAEEFYRTAINQDPRLTVAVRNLAMLLLAEKKGAEALELMRKIIKEAPESDESRELLPVIRQLEKNLPKGA